MRGKKLIVLSLGGSIVAPDAIDVGFLRKFASFIKKNLPRFRFIIVVGGGATNRRYNEAAWGVGKTSHEDLDWIGIMATRLNAELVRVTLGNLAEKRVAYNPREKFAFKKPILIGAGYVPGSSSDLDAVELAQTYGAKKVINLSNTDYAYDRDPKKFKSAKPIKTIAWKDFLKIVGKKWSPRMHAPFDPVASRAAQKLGLQVITADGRNLQNLQKVLDGGKFKGTIIK